MMVIRIAILLLVTLAPLTPMDTCGQSRKAELAQSHSLISSARVGDVSQLDGEVWLKRRGGTDLQPLRIGENLCSGDLVLTGAEGRIEWSLNPNSYLQVGPLSQVLLYETNSHHMHFDIYKGEVFLIVSNLDKTVVLELDTPYALLTVVKRGRYRARVAPNDTEAIVVQGKLHFVNSKGQTGTVTERKQVHFFVPKE